MKCQHCGWDNQPNFVLCANCHRKRVIDLSADAQISTVPKPSESVRGSGTSASASPAAGMPRFNRDATRYLCAALQMNPALNNKAIRRIIDEKHRAIASSPGVDLVTVLKYGLAARRRQLIRDTILVVLLAIGVIVPVLYTDEPGWIAQVDLGWVFLPWPVALAAWIVVFVETLWTYYRVLSAHLRRDSFDPTKAPSPASRRVTRRLADIQARDRGNLTVFPGGIPFIGYGIEINGWSFTLNLAKAEEGKNIVPFTVHDLHDFIADAVTRLGLPDVIVEDRLFISGLDLLHGFEPSVQHAILPDELAAPVSRVDNALVAQLQDDPNSRARPYLAVRIGGWSGELVVTMFLRFALTPQKDSLFVEANYRLLPPVRKRYQAVDRLLNRPTLLQLGRLAAKNLIGIAPALLGGAWRIVTVSLAPPLRWTKLWFQTLAIKEDRTFNYGPKMSLREQASNARYQRYFQRRDREMYAKSTEQCVMDALTEFMTKHNIDTAPLAEPRTKILNQGIYVTGQGKVIGRSIAAGVNAFASTLTGNAQGRPPTNKQG